MTTPKVTIGKDTITIPRKWLETLLAHAEEAEREPSNVVRIAKLIGFASSAETLLKHS